VVVVGWLGEGETDKKNEVKKLENCCCHCVITGPLDSPPIVPMDHSS